MGGNTSVTAGAFPAMHEEYEPRRQDKAWRHRVGLSLQANHSRIGFSPRCQAQRGLFCRSRLPEGQELGRLLDAALSHFVLLDQIMSRASLRFCRGADTHSSVCMYKVRKILITPAPQLSLLVRYIQCACGCEERDEWTQRS